MFREKPLRRAVGVVVLTMMVAGPGLAAADFFPTSSESLITRGELANASCDELWQARNEIYARGSYKFQTARGIAAFGADGTTGRRDDEQPEVQRDRAREHRHDHAVRRAKRLRLARSPVGLRRTPLSIHRSSAMSGGKAEIHFS